MGELAKFVKEVNRVSKEIERILSFISLNREKVSYESIVLQRLGLLIFDEDIDNYQLPDHACVAFDWIIENHNLSIRMRKHHYKDQTPLFDEITGKPIPGKFVSKSEKNYIDLNLLKLDFEQFLKKTKEYRTA